jgi:hypothetical protein
MSAELMRLTKRRRGLERLESEVVRRYLADPTGIPDTFYEVIRYVLCFSRLLSVTNPDGEIVDVSGPMAAFSMTLQNQISERLDSHAGLDGVFAILPQLIERTRATRRSLLDRLQVHRDSLEKEVTTRLLAIASGGGGGAGYVYLGTYTALDRHDLVPSLMVGTSIGSLTSLFRSRTRHYDLAVAVASSRNLSWKDVFRVLETDSRYGLPATLRMYLQSSLGPILNRSPDQPLLLSDMEIPLYVMATGITVEALKHDLHHYEHLMDGSMERRGTRAVLRNTMRGLGILREFLSTPDALKEIVLGYEPGTEQFNAIDATGFSSAVPGVLHYDVLRDDPSMTKLLDQLYADHGITRLGEGGLVSNVPARAAWSAVTEGRFSGRQPFVLALDCFAPNPRKPLWYPLQQMIRSANVESDRAYADVYVPMRKTLSPMNLVPPIRDAVIAMKWGEEAVAPHLPFICEMMRPVGVLKDL